VRACSTGQSNQLKWLASHTAGASRGGSAPCTRDVMPMPAEKARHTSTMSACWPNRLNSNASGTTGAKSSAE
jgi:hypothetical protein